MKNNDDLNKILGSQNVPEPSAEAKRMAINLAMAEFEKASAQKNQETPQGIFTFARLTIGLNNVLTSCGRVFMYLFKQKLIIGGMATSCAVLLGFLMVFQASDSDIKNQTDIFLVEKDEEIEGVAPVSVSEARLEKSKRNDNDAITETVVVTGARRQLQDSMDIKREASTFVDAISEEDIGLFPNANIAEPLQRVPGIEGKLHQPMLAAKKHMNLAADGVVSPPINEGRDQFETITENTVKKVSEEPVSTFSIDVDTASYSFVRRQLNGGVLPQKAAVRVEEMLNYFDYAYPQPENKQQPFKTSIMVTDSPWNAHATKNGKKLVHIGIKGYDMESAKLPKTNLVFLLDVSGSMSSADKLPLVKQSMNLLLNKLQPEDTVAIAVYAGAAGTVLPPTPVKEKQKIIAALDKLSAGGSTAGAEGIHLAYELAEANFDKNAVNRVILATDGDFNVGISNRNELKGFVERKKDKGVYLSVLGFGQGNYNDHMMQALAQNGNGVAAYIDTLSEAQKVLVNEATSSLFPIATDVKIQVEFNPETVSEYRLVGYETRHLNREDFNNDKVDAGDIGAGHTVTAIYEITPVNSDEALIDSSRYEENKNLQISKSEEYGFVKLRYKLPGERASKLISMPIVIKNGPLSKILEREMGFATAVAGFAQLLKGGKYTGNLTYQNVIDQAQSNKGADEYGYRTEFVQLVRKASVASEM